MHALFLSCLGDINVLGWSCAVDGALKWCKTDFNSQHTMELISAQNVYHKYNNKDLGRLR